MVKRHVFDENGCKAIVEEPYFFHKFWIAECERFKLVDQTTGSYQQSLLMDQSLIFLEYPHDMKVVVRVFLGPELGVSALRMNILSIICFCFWLLITLNCSNFRLHEYLSVLRLTNKRF